MKQLTTSYRRWLLIGLVVLNVGCDQVSKVVLRKEISSSAYIEVVGDVFTMTKIENTGAFLGLGSELSGTLRFLLLLLLPSLVMVGLFVYVWLGKQLNWLEVVSMAFIIGGGIGNLFDRFVYGSVSDFFHLDFGIFETGVFNLADVSVMIGTFALLISSFTTAKKTKSQEKEEPVSVDPTDGDAS